MKHLTTRKAKAAIAAGLGMALVLGPVPQVAWARRAQDSITITSQQEGTITYQAYQLFKADVSPDDRASHVAWPTEAMQGLVTTFLKQEGYGQWIAERGLPEEQAERAQNALEFVVERIGTSDSGTKTPEGRTIVSGTSFATRLARYLGAHNAHCSLATAGVTFTGEEGYWLFVTQPSSLQGADKAATAPIWIAIGGSVHDIVEKAGIPTVTKLVQEDSTGTFGTAADANRGQEMTYRLTGTLPSDFAAYESYHYRFEDRFSEGIELACDASRDPAEVVTIKVGDHEVAADGTNLTVTWDGSELAVDFADLASAHWDGLQISRDTPITVEYPARLTEKAVIGSAGNDNSVVVRYRNDPLSSGEGVTTPPPSPRLFTYALRLMKVDEQTAESLSGAGFTIQVADKNADAASRGKYVQADGSLADQPHEFLTGPDGSFTVEGVDEGSYVFAETTPPEGYEHIDDDVTVEVTSSIDARTNAFDDFVVLVKGGDKVETEAAVEGGLTSVDTDTGLITFTVTNDKRIALPLTGLAGIQGGAGAAAAVAAGSALMLLRRRGAAAGTRKTLRKR